MLRAALVVIGSMVFSSEVLSFSIKNHRDMTKSALESQEEELSNGIKIKFSERAIEQIMDANENVDSNVSFSAALFRPERHFTNEDFAGSTSRILNLKNQVVDSLLFDPPFALAARLRFGEALHTIQDYYSHSNYPERNSGIDNDLGRRTKSNPPINSPCPIDNSVLGSSSGGSATSGYFVGFTFDRDTFGCVVDELPSRNDCFHGNYKPTCVGINKDLSPSEASSYGVPSSPLHQKAFNLAKEATEDLYMQVLSSIRGNDRAVQAFLDSTGTIGFVVDDTGSMGDDISRVSNIISRLVNRAEQEAESGGNSSRSAYLLERFGDPSVGRPFVTADPSTLLSRVNSIRVGGGGDCPERSMSGLLAALDDSTADSRLFLFTDAAAKDARLAGTVSARAQAKTTRIYPILTGTCSPIDESYVRVAEETGGLLFLIDTDEIPLLGSLIEPLVVGNLVTLTSQKGSLAGESTTLEIAVDETISQILFTSVLSGSISIEVQRPNGDVATDADGDVEMSVLGSGPITSIANPDPGTWKVNITGSGEYALTVDGTSGLEFYRFDFVSPNEDIHGGLIPISGQPIAGNTSLLEATLLGERSSARFDFVDENGNELQTLTLKQDYPNAAASHYVGEGELPTVPFRIVVRGESIEGFSYQRQYPTLFRSRSVGVEVVLDENLNSIRAGELQNISLRITNFGEDGVFRVTAADNLGSIIDVGSDVEISRDQVIEKLINITVPAEVEMGRELVLTITVASIDDPDSNNSAILSLIVIPEDDKGSGKGGSSSGGRPKGKNGGSSGKKSVSTPPPGSKRSNKFVLRRQGMPMPLIADHDTRRRANQRDISWGTDRLSIETYLNGIPTSNGGIVDISSNRLNWVYRITNNTHTTIKNVIVEQKIVWSESGDYKRICIIRELKPKAKARCKYSQRANKRMRKLRGSMVVAYQKQSAHRMKKRYNVSYYQKR